MTIPTDKIREVIGPGGKVIRGIIEQTGVKIDVDDDGTVNIFAADGDSRQEGHADGHRHRRGGRSRQDLPGQGGPASSISARSSRSSPAPTACCTSARSARTASREVRDELKEGDQILVKVLALEGNKIKLSRKAVLAEQREKLGVKPAEEGEVPVAVERKAEPGDRPEGGGDRGGDRGDRGETVLAATVVATAAAVAVTAGANSQFPPGGGSPPPQYPPW